MQGLQFYLDAYRELLTERSIGMAAGQIPWSSIQHYARVYGLDGDETEIFQSHIRTMERVDHEIEESKK